MIAVPREESLRQRKKRETRQLISDVATGMFLEVGFDRMKVSDVAARCGVSEKTVYNYFPTKESMILDREQPMLDAVCEALGPNGSVASPVEAILAVLYDDLDEMYGYWSGLDDPSVGVQRLRRFVTSVRQTPSLRAAQFVMMERLVDGAARSMAERAGVDPLDPEPQIAANALMGLLRIEFGALCRLADGSLTPREIRDEVRAELQRAAMLIETGIWTFTEVVSSGNDRKVIATGEARARLAQARVLRAIRRARRERKRG